MNSIIRDKILSLYLMMSKPESRVYAILLENDVEISEEVIRANLSHAYSLYRTVDEAIEFVIKKFVKDIPEIRLINDKIKEIEESRKKRIEDDIVKEGTKPRQHNFRDHYLDNKLRNMGLSQSSISRLDKIKQSNKNIKISIIGKIVNLSEPTLLKAGVYRGYLCDNTSTMYFEINNFLNVKQLLKNKTYIIKDLHTGILSKTPDSPKLKYLIFDENTKVVEIDERYLHYLA
jgi:hypothetical protein